MTDKEPTQGQIEEQGNGTITLLEDPALALFWAIWEVVKEEQGNGTITL